MNGQTLTLMANWLDDVTAPQTASTLTVTPNGVTGNYYYSLATGGYQYPWAYITIPEQAKPIKLTMREVEHLRKAAKANEELKKILAKFTAHIEVVVDFN